MNRTTLLVTLLLAASLAVTPGAVAAQQDCTVSEPADIDPLLQAYNENADAVPGFVRNQIAGERVEFRVTGDTTVAYTIVFNETGHALDATQGSDNPSLRVTAEAASLCDAATGNNPIQSLVNAYDSGEIRIEGTSPVSQVTVTVVEIGISVGRMLNLF